jgi:hypothetical protein
MEKLILSPSQQAKIDQCRTIKAELGIVNPVKSITEGPSIEERTLYHDLLGTYANSVANTVPLVDELKLIIQDPFIEKSTVKHLRKRSNKYIHELVSIQGNRLRKSERVLHTLPEDMPKWKELQTSLVELNLHRSNKLKAKDTATGLKILQGMLKENLLEIINLKKINHGPTNKIRSRQHEAARIINEIRTLETLSFTQQLKLDVQSSAS